MARLIDIEQLRAKKVEKTRLFALKTFPWDEADQSTSQFFSSLIHFWPKSQKTLLRELIYRLEFEAYSYGIKERRNVRYVLQQLFPQEDWQKVYLIKYQVSTGQLIEKIYREFAMDWWLEERKQSDVRILLEDMVRTWFMKGAQKSIGYKL